ncbi:MAG: SMC-Scp complex subunit ScpB, partial [Candidatus Obscuribacterales bacterium]|nr:SMC-Scp complex subunit ScpB [Candidatus Obscuribacterales bacterium]
MSLKAKIEAVLYMTEKPLRAQAIAGIVGEEVQLVRTALLELIHEYEERQGGLEIADEDGYSFQVKDQYANLMDQFLPIEMTAAQLRTLSAIAIKQPIMQSEIIRIRGASAYDHIKELVLRGLVSKREDEGVRSPLLSTTKAFQEYFRLTKDGKSLRTYLKKEMKKKDKEEELLAAPPPAIVGNPEDMYPADLSPLAETDFSISDELAPLTEPAIVAEPIPVSGLTISVDPTLLAGMVISADPKSVSGGNISADPNLVSGVKFADPSAVVESQTADDSSPELSSAAGESTIVVEPSSASGTTISVDPAVVSRSAISVAPLVLTPNSSGDTLSFA